MDARPTAWLCLPAPQHRDDGCAHVYAEPEKVTAGEGPVDVYGMPSPNFADFDNDGDLDLLCGEFLDGFSYFENVGSAQRASLCARRGVWSSPANRCRWTCR